MSPQDFKFEDQLKKEYTCCMQKKQILISAVLAAFLILTGAKLIFDYLEQEDQKRRQAAYEKTYESLKADINSDMLQCEYGSEYRLEDLAASHTGELSFEGRPDPMKPGDYTVKLKLSAPDDYGEEVEREFLYSISVTDTKAPEITLVSDTVTITAGDPADLLSNVEAVNDPVDGALEYSETEENGRWTLHSDYDPETPGDYTVNVRAADINGNITEAQFTLTVEAKDVIVPTAGYGNPYYIRINRALNTVTVYALNNEGSYEPYSAFICSTGPATPLGTYTTFNKSRWRLLYGPCYGQYVTDIVGDILFHSVPYYTMYEGDLEYYEYNKLGTAASMGCIRLCVRDALWIYSNCPVGTVVELYDDWESYGPLGRPESIQIDPESPNRGWDPTDPSPSNPWNQ